MEMGIYYSRRSPAVVILWCLIPFPSIPYVTILFHFIWKGEFNSIMEAVLVIYVHMIIHMWMYADAV